MNRRLLSLLMIFPLLSVLAGCDNVKTVETDVGNVQITDKGDNDLSHVTIKCNNGMVIDADWRRNSYNEFGYDVHEPSVSETYNRFAVMVTVRSVIANYLNGNYD